MNDKTNIIVTNQKINIGSFYVQFAQCITSLLTRYIIIERWWEKSTIFLFNTLYFPESIDIKYGWSNQVKYNPIIAHIR